MRRSKYYNMRLPERGAREGEANDAADIEDLTYDLEIIDKEMERQRLEDVRMEKEKATKLELSQHKSAAVLDHPDNSVTDAKLGQRTVLTTSGPLQTLLTAIGNAIKAISGADTWNGTPATTLTEARAHMDSKSNPHGVTKTQVGLGNADNTSDANKPVSTAQAAAIKVVQDDVNAHKSDTSNPHAVTKAQVGLGSVPNVPTNDQTPTYTAASAPAALASGEKLSVAYGKLAASVSALIAHLADGVKHITAAERTKWNGAVDAQHSHINKALLDTYTQTEANLAAAVTAKHSHSNKNALDGITAAMVTTWNTVSSKLPLAGGTLTGFLTLHAAPTANMHAATKKYVDDKMAASGSGDMLKSVYDTNEDGVVDKAETVPWSGVTGKPSTFPPSTHTHTKNQITDFPASLKNPNALTISLNGTSQGAYDGSAAKSINITAAGVGALPSEGTAADANKLGGHSPQWWMPTGMVVPYAGAAAPDGWLLCQGQAVSRTTYAQLFSVIGTTYGSGDGSTTFNLPDMRGRVAVGSDANLGAKAGAKTHALTNAELPVLSGAIVMHSSNVGTNIQTVNGVFKPAITNNGKYRGGGELVSDIGTSSVGHFSLNIGGGQAMSLIQPSLYLNYLIKV